MSRILTCLVICVLVAFNRWDLCISTFHGVTRSADGVLEVSLGSSRVPSLKHYSRNLRRPPVDYSPPELGLRSLSLFKLGGFQRDEILVHNFNDMYYYTFLEVGDPPQIFKVLLDTGSSALWLPSAQLLMEDSSYPRSHRVFYNTNSRTYKSVDKEAYQKYGKGGVSGVLARDTFKMGKFQWHQQLFIEVLNVDNDTALKEYDGIFGLGKRHRGGGDAGSEPPFLSMHEQNIVSKPVFSISLSRNSLNIEADISFGGIDEKKYIGNIIFTKTFGSLWNFKVESMLIGNHTLIDMDLKAIPDSGSSLIYVPDFLITDVREKCGAFAHPEIEEIYLVNCSLLHELPHITFMVEDTPLHLSAVDYTLQMPDDDDSTVCMLAITSSPTLDFFLLGSPFMRRYYTIFDHHNKRIGFAHTSN